MPSWIEGSVFQLKLCFTVYNSLLPNRFCQKFDCWYGSDGRCHHHGLIYTNPRRWVRAEQPMAYDLSSKQVRTYRWILIVLYIILFRSMTVRGHRRARLHREGFILDKFFFRRHWGHEEVTRRLRESFPNKLDNGTPIRYPNHVCYVISLYLWFTAKLMGFLIF